MSEQVVFNLDCREADPSLFDVMITDPPYREHVHTKATSHSSILGTRHRDMGFTHLDPPLRLWIGTCAARIKRWSVIYSDVESTNWLRLACQAKGATYIRTMCWVRWSMPQLSGDRPPTGWEALLLTWGSQAGRKAWNGPGNLTHLSHKCLRGEDKHKAEKPLDQCLSLVEWFSNPGDTILDLFSGAGTIGVACAILDRNYVGFEIDSKWADFASDRIEKAKQQQFSNRDIERITRWQISGKV